jgi:hypothetical protein
VLKKSYSLKLLRLQALRPNPGPETLPLLSEIPYRQFFSHFLQYKKLNKIKGIEQLCKLAWPLLYVAKVNSILCILIDQFRYE